MLSNKVMRAAISLVFLSIKNKFNTNKKRVLPKALTKDRTVVLFFGYGPLAQLVEHIPFKDGVDGSNPSRLTFTHTFNGLLPEMIPRRFLSALAVSWKERRLFMFLKALLLLNFATLSSVVFANTISPLSFFQTIQGDYRILSSGLNIPKGGTEVGYVAIEENEGLIVLPYCHVEGGVCDPGFRAFPLDNTTIREEKTESGNTRFTLETVDGGTSRRYFWENRGQAQYFLDPDYSLVSGENFPLEFVIERIQ